MNAAERIDEMRREKGWSKAELARRAGLDRAHVSRIISGSGFTVATLSKLVKALEVDDADHSVPKLAAPP
jgi:transcriptional regulator with XRE-family HTH domain